MKLGSKLNIFIAGILIPFLVAYVGLIICVSAPQITVERYCERRRMETDEYREAGFYNITVTDQNSSQYKLGNYLASPMSWTLSPLAIFVNRLNGWWKKR